MPVDWSKQQFHKLGDRVTGDSHLSPAQFLIHQAEQATWDAAQEDIDPDFERDQRMLEHEDWRRGDR